MNFFLAFERLLRADLVRYRCYKQPNLKELMSSQTCVDALRASAHLRAIRHGLYVRYQWVKSLSLMTDNDSTTTSLGISQSI